MIFLFFAVLLPIGLGGFLAFRAWPALAKVVLFAFVIASGVPISHLLEHLFEGGIYIADLRLAGLIWFGFLGVLVLSIGALLRPLQLRQLLAAPWVKWYLAYLGWMGAGIAYSDYPLVGVERLLEKSLPLVAYVCVVQQLHLGFLKPAELVKVIWSALFVTAVFMCINPLIGRPLVARDYSGTLRFMGSMGWATFAYFLTPYYIVSLSELIRTERFKFLVIGGGIAVAVCATLARAAIVPMVVISIVFWVLWRTESKMAITPLVVLVAGVIATVFLPPLIQRTFYSGQINLSHFLSSGRFMTAEYLLAEGLRTPMDWVIGIGSGTANKILDPLSRLGVKRTHSALLSGLTDNGLIGVGLFVLAPVTVLWQLLRSWLSRTFSSDTKNGSAQIFIRLAFVVTLCSLYVFDDMRAIYTLSVLFAMMAVVDFGSVLNADVGLVTSSAELEENNESTVCN